MLALPLLLALAAADPAPSDAAPPVPAEAAAQVAPAPPAPAEGGAGAEGPGLHVTPPDAPGLEAPAEPAPPFRLDGFVPAGRVVVGATVRAGGSRAGLEGAVEPTARWHGAVAGVTVGGATWSGEGVRTLGLVAGYGLSRGLYRGEALFGWGLASDRRDLAGATDVRSGHFRSVQLGLDRAVCGGDAWRATVGAGLWWRATFGLGSAPTGHDELGGGLRLGLETAL